MTIPPQSNVTINVSLPGVQFVDPADNIPKTCKGETLIQKANRCFYDVDFNESLIPVNQNVLDAATERCNNNTETDGYATDCCVNATIDDGPSETFVARDLFFAAACDSTTRAINNGDGRFHTAAEQTWTPEYFQGASPDDIKRNITNLFRAGYHPELVRKTPVDAGSNGICRPSSRAPTERTAKTLHAKPPTPNTNTRTELHTTCIVPHSLIDDTLAATIPNPFQNNSTLVKRWALHMLIAANATLDRSAADFFNPTVYARAHIKLAGQTMDSYATRASLPRTVVDALRHYGTNLRGSFPAAFYNLTATAYKYGTNSQGYTLKDYFQMCPKDYFETGGHPLLSYQWFVKPDPAKHKHYLQKFSGVTSDTPDAGYEFAERHYGKSQAFDPVSEGLDCKVQPIDGVPFGSPFWDTPPKPEPNWGLFGLNISNFKLNCSGENSIDWARLVKDLAGYNGRPTAGNVAPQLMVNQMGTRTAYNVYENRGPDSGAKLPPDIPVCDESTPWLGPRSRGFVDAVELRMNVDVPGKLAKTGKRSPGDRLGIVASSLAALHGIPDTLFRTQSYSVAYATLGCTDCIQHNHGGAGTLFPAFQVQGSRPRYADLVGTRDGDMVTGSCGQINDISLGPNPPNVAEGGKFYSAPLNSEHICAVFSGTPCGDPGEGIKRGADAFFEPSPAGEPQTFDKKINGANYGQWVNQYNLPSSQMSFNGQDNLMFNVGKSDTSIPYFSHHDREILSGQNGGFYSINPVDSNKYNPADLFRTQACSFNHAKGMDWVKNPPCDPRHYDVDVAKGRFGCTNARVVGRHSRDYSVWPFVSVHDPSGNVSSTAYAHMVPSGLFFGGATIDPIMTEAEFLSKARQRGATYAAIRQLFPKSRAILERSADGNKFTTRYVSATNITGFDSCQCFVGPNDADGQPAPPGEPYQATGSTDHPFEGCGFRESWNKGRGQPNWYQYSCNPVSNLTSFKASDPKAGVYFNCANKDGDGSCWSSELPQSPGPLPQTSGWTKADVENGSLRSGTGPRWWTEALPGIPSIRFGTWFYFAKTVPSFAPRDIFNKKLYIAKGLPKHSFGADDLEEWIEVAMLNISGYSDWAMFSVKQEDERDAYVVSETRDMCADFGRTDNQTYWKYQTLHDPLFTAMLDPGTNVTFSSTAKNASKWDQIGNVSVCSGNLHTMPSFSPGVCGPIRTLEDAALKQATDADVPCAFPPIELPVCGNPYFSSQGKIERPLLPGNQYAHYCAPTTKNDGWYNTSTADPDGLEVLECTGDTLTPAERQTFCAEGGFLGIRGKRVAIDRPADSVCSKDTHTCIAFAADAVWTLEKIIAHADKTLTDDYTIVVVPVNASVMHSIPLGIAYEDLSLANRFLYIPNNIVTPPNTYPYSDEGSKLRSQPALTKTLCTGPTEKNINDGAADDPLSALRDAIDIMRRPDGICNQGPGLDPIQCNPGDYCVPQLKTTNGRPMAACVTEAEMFPSVADASITIARKNVNLVPATVFGRPIKFGVISGSPPATCVRITVKALGFKTTNLDFDQSNCGGLQESQRAGIVYAGQSAIGSSITNVVIRGAPGAGVVYTGNRDDGDNPYLTVGPGRLQSDSAADAVLNGLSFAVTELDNALGGIVAASARTLGTQIVSQCVAGLECNNIRGVQSSECFVTPFCPQGPCPYARNAQECTKTETLPCPDRCTYHIRSDGQLGCTYGPKNDTTTPLFPTPESFDVTRDRGVTILKSDVNGLCMQNVYPFNFTRCDPIAANQRWFVEYVAAAQLRRLNPAGRPFSCVVHLDDEPALLPCDGCDASTEETTDACASTQPFGEVVFPQNTHLPGATFVRVAYSNATLGVAAYRNGSCAMTNGGVWDECRTECIEVNKSTCNTTEFAAGLLAACGHSGSLAAIQTFGTCASGSTANITQGPEVIVPATARCVEGQYILVAHGLGYTTGTAYVGLEQVNVWVSTAIVQPYDEFMTVSGTGVSVLNLTALTGLFDRAFEARLTGADRTTTWYLLGAVLAFTTGIVITTIACIRLKRD
tara:strand:- start:3646 stop:9708 length:6063 start_codon:yes stop_codon:yes gene_type:complete